MVRQADPALGAALPAGTEALLIVEVDGDEEREVRSRLDAVEMNCAEAIRRGLPSTVSEKSSAIRSDTGRPVLSMTLTSTDTMSTDEVNEGRGS